MSIQSNYINNSFNRLKGYCEKKDFKGWDLYDGLNSRFFLKSPLKNSRLLRLFWIQLFKHSPVNLRGIFFIPQTHNPKGLALFLSGYANMYKIFGNITDKEKIDYLLDKLLSLQNKEHSNACWGYNFHWQSRSFFLPKFTPNAVVTTFVGNALLDVYEITEEDRLLEICRSICDFILNDLNKTYDDKRNFCFSYSTLDKSQIFNASLLTSRFLARVYHFTNDIILKEASKKSVQFCVNHQNKDGSWYYGLANNQKWIDSFHTGYNLEAIYDYQLYTKDRIYNDSFDKGLRYYLSTFFHKKGISRYYASSTYPFVDIHSIAELIVLYAKTGSFNEKYNLVNSILGRVIENMQHQDGYFYHQATRHYKIKIPYIRWCQAWMFYALSWYIIKLRKI